MTIGTRAISDLRQNIQGTIILPGERPYEEARKVWVGHVDRRPALIARATSACDVAAGIAFAREQGLALAVRSGGHSVAGHGAVEGGLLVDLSPMNRLDIDANRRVARIEPGLTWGAVAGQLEAHGLALTSGDVASVGVGGLALGGGIGWMVRKHGLTIDHLLSVELVTADGEILTASAEENADLFWGLRGGGGNFGVATAFEFTLDPCGMILGGAIFYDAANAEEILSAYVAYATGAPDELTSTAMILAAPPAPFIPPHMQGRPVLMLVVCYSGDLSVGASVVDPLRRLDNPVADLIGPMPYPALLGMTEASARPGQLHEMRSTFLDRVDAGLVKTLAAQAATVSGPGAMIQLRMLGGAMARVAPNATAFAHRDKPALLSLVNGWRNPAESVQRSAWTAHAWHAWRPYAAGAYANFLEDEGEARIHEAYPAATYARLARLKERYDAANVFRLNQNIKPLRGPYALGRPEEWTEGAA